MANQPQYLPFAGDWPDEMYLWERWKIYEFLDDVVDDPLAFNVGTPSEELRPIRDQIRLLSVAEPGFDPIELNREPPRQHILRTVNPQWEANFLENSKFNTPKIWEHQFNSNETEDLRPPRNRQITVTKARHYWSPYDLLGLFLSKLGRAQPQATEDNFYLPLTAMYSQWSAQIGGRRAKGVGDMSKYYQCTYRPDTGEFFLGATLAGYDPDWNNQFQVGQWKEGHPVPEDLFRPSIRKGLQWSRYEILKRNFPGFGWEFMQSPVLQTQVDGHKFGNCAETYPFMEMLGYRGEPLLSQDWDVLQRCRGFALDRDYAFSHWDFYDPAAIRERHPQDPDNPDVIPPLRYLASPCSNCQTLIESTGANLRNFTQG